jgi:hypothetical protein
MNTENTQKERLREIIFFLGAGASVPAGVPDTRSFIYGKTTKDDTGGFLENIKKSGIEGERKVLEALLERLEGKLGKKQIDLEKVLESITELNNLSESVLPEFFEEKKFIFDQEDLKHLRNLEKKLREFIRERTMVSDDKVEYLGPLRDFVPLRIYSVNYDTCIEQFCKKYSLTYTDGFELYWHPDFFGEEEKYDVKHYKLHGSVMWWLTNRNTYVKIPIGSPVENIELITGEIARNVMSYPVPGKTDYERPLLDLKSMLYHDLKQARMCIVIGYSFRDESLRQIFYEASEENNDLLIVLISPSARDIYRKQLKFRSDRGFSSLEGRVICLNYPMETVLNTGFLWRMLKIVEEIRLAFVKGEEYRKEEMGGGWIHQLSDCVLNCAEIGYIDRAETILKKHLGLNLEDLETSRTFRELGKRFQLSYLMGISLVLNGCYSEALKFLQNLHFLLKEMFDMGNEVFEVGSTLAMLRAEKERLQTVKLRYSGQAKPEIVKELPEGSDLDEKISEQESKLGSLQRRDEYSHSLFWYVRDSEWGREYFHKCVKFLQTQVELLGNTKKDLVMEHLNPILTESDEIWEIISDRTDSGKPDHEKKIEIAGTTVETERKKESEKHFKQMLDSIQELVLYCRNNGIH